MTRLYLLSLLLLAAPAFGQQPCRSFSECHPDKPNPAGSYVVITMHQGRAS